MRKIFKYRFVLLLLCFLLSIGIVDAQNNDQFKIDSIKKINLLEIDKRQLVDNYNQIAFLYGAINVDSSLSYSQKGKDLAKTIKYIHGLAVSYSYAAHAHMEKSQLAKSMENYDLALTLFVELQDSVNILDCYRGMSYVTSYGASQFKSLNYNLSALEIAEKLKDTTSLAVIYNNIGAIYKRLDKYKLALDYFEKSVLIEKKRQNLEDLAISYSNIGVLKVENGVFKEAENDYRVILNLIPQIKNSYILSYLYLSLSGYYSEAGKIDSANYFIDIAGKLCQEYGFSHIQSRLYRRKAEILFRQKDYRECIRQFDNCLDLSQSLGVREEFPEIYKMKADAYFALGNSREAYLSLKKANSAIDSLKLNKVTGFLEEYEIQKRENDLKQQKLEQALQEQKFENASIRMKDRFAIAILAIVILISLILFVFYFFLKVKKNNAILISQHRIIQKQKAQLESSVVQLKKSEEDLKVLNATKDRFFSIIAHDLKSPFNSLLGFNEMLIEEIQKKNYSEIEDYAKQVNVVLKESFALLNNLLDWSRDKTGEMLFSPERINLNDFLSEILDYFRKIAPNHQITIGQMTDTELIADRNMLQVILRNLVSNAIKYTPENGRISLGVESGDGEIRISVKDTGIGIKAETLNKLFKIEESVSTYGLKNEKGTGLGLLLCKDFVEKHQGKIWVESDLEKGSTFSFTIPNSQKS